MSRLSATRLVLAGLVLVSAGLPATASAEGADEIVHLAELVAFLRGRVRAEHPALLDDPGGQVREFREELAKLDLDPPAGVPLDPFLDDLRMAGLLYEEQLRRRRNARRNALIAETDRALADIFQGAIEVANDPAGASIVPEVARIFQVIHSGRRAPGAPEPASATAAIVSTAHAASRPGAKDLSTRTLAEPAMSALAKAGQELRDALAADPAKARAAAASGFGDVTQKVASAEAPRVVVRQVAPLVAALPRPQPAVRAQVPRKPTPARGAALAPKPAPPRRAAAPGKIAPAPPRRAAAPVKIAPAPRGLASDDREHLAQVLAKVKALVAPQVSGDAEFPGVLRGTLSTFGIKAPESFRPRVGDTPQQMADALLLTSSGAFDLSLARAALAL